MKIIDIIKKNRIPVVIGSVVLVIALVSTIFILRARSYFLSSSVDGCMALVPDTALSYIECASLETAITKFKASPLGSEILSSPEWKSALLSPGLIPSRELFYILQITSGSILSLDNLERFVGGSAGVASFQDGRYLLTMQLDIKSKFALSLLTTFTANEEQSLDKKNKSVKESDRDKIVNEGKSQRAVEELFAQSQNTFANVTINSFKMHEGMLYLTMLDDYLFVANSLDLLQESIVVASSGKGSLRDLPLMKDTYNDVSKNSIFVYLDGKNSSAAPLICGTTAERGMAAIFDFSADTTSGSLYTIPFEVKTEEKKSPAVKALAFQDFYPSDPVAVFFSNSQGMGDLIQSFENLGKKQNNVYKSSESFLSTSGIKVDDYFQKQSGFLFAFDELKPAGDMIYPLFTIGYTEKTNPEKIAQALFKAVNPETVNYQQKSYTLFKINEEGSFYTPSLYRSGTTTFMSSTKEQSEKIIGSVNGNRARLSDLKSYQQLGEYKHAQHQLIVNIDSLLESLQRFYLYGAKRSTAYSEKSIESDIMPLFAPFKKYGVVHAAYNSGSGRCGSLLITEK